MRLELPPERELPSPERMVERILTDAPSAGLRPAARTYWIGGLAAAAVAITAAVIGWAVILPTDRSQVGAPPTSSAVSGAPSNLASPTVGPSSAGAVSTSSPPSTASDPGKRTAESRPTTLVPTRPASSADKPKSSAPARTPSASQTSTVKPSAEPPSPTAVPIGVRVQAPYLDLTASGTMTGGDVYAILVETCVRSLPSSPASDLLLSSSSWTLSTSAGTVTTDAPITDPITLPSTYPDEGRYGIGDCASGWIPFGVASDATVVAISYQNSLGANVTWNPNT